jgi:hypothetical protein
VVPSISLPSRFSTRSIPRIVAHLEALGELAEDADWPDQDWPELEAEVARVAEAAGGWRDAAQEALDNEEARAAPREDRVDALGERVEELEAVVAALENQDLAEATLALGEMEPAAPPPALPPAVVVDAAPLRPRIPRLERLEAEARSYRPRIDAMRDQPDAQALDQLELDLLDLFDRALEAATRTRGEERRQTMALAECLERAAGAFQDIRDAGLRADLAAYLEALDRLAECCPE